MKHKKAEVQYTPY